MHPDTHAIPNRSHAGFTLVELLLSMTLMVIVLGMTIPFYYTIQIRNDVDIAADVTVQSLRRAQMLSQAVHSDTNWGVKVLSGSITVFRGTSYAARNAAYDERFSVPSTITPSGVHEVVFSEMFGMPGTTGTVTLSSTAGRTRSVVINAKGMIQY